MLLPSSLDRASSIHWPTRLTAHTTSVAVEADTLLPVSHPSPGPSCSSRPSCPSPRWVTCKPSLRGLRSSASPWERVASTRPRTSIVLPSPISSQMKPPLGIAEHLALEHGDAENRREQDGRQCRDGLPHYVTETPADPRGRSCAEETEAGSRHVTCQTLQAASPPCPRASQDAS